MYILYIFILYILYIVIIITLLKKRNFMHDSKADAKI